jgi:hypothetical protein
MPDDDDRDDNLLRFELGRKPKPKPNGRMPQANRPSIDPVDLIAAGAVVAALALAIAMVSGWIPTDDYTIGLVACAVAGAVVAKLVKARRRPKAPVTKLPNRRH